MGRVEMKDPASLDPGRLQREAGLVGGQVCFLGTCDCCPRASSEEKGQDGLREGWLGPQAGASDMGADRFSGPQTEPGEAGVCVGGRHIGLRGLGAGG